jgi:hypothetical protein
VSSCKEASIAAAVVDGPQIPDEEPARELVGVHLVGLVARPPALAAAVADDHPVRDGDQGIMQPLRLGAFLERDVNRAPHAMKELDQRSGLRGYESSGDHAPAPFPDRHHGRCLMHVESDILGRPLHEGRSLVWSMGLPQIHGSTKGRALNMR